MPKSKTETIVVKSPLGELKVEDHSLFIFHGNRRDLRGLDKRIRKARPEWVGGIVALGPDENLGSLTTDQSLQLCHTLMKHYYPTVLKAIESKLEEFADGTGVEELVAEMEAEEGEEGGGTADVEQGTSERISE